MRHRDRGKIQLLLLTVAVGVNAASGASRIAYCEDGSLSPGETNNIRDHQSVTLTDTALIRSRASSPVRRADYRFQCEQMVHGWTHDAQTHGRAHVYTDGSLDVRMLRKRAEKTGRDTCG